MKTEKSILIVDDDGVFRHSVIYALRGNNYKIIQASDAREALNQMIEHRDVGVVILDLNLGASTGNEFLEGAKGRYPDFRVIVLTEREDILSAEAAREYKVFNYLPKASRSFLQSLRFTVEQAFRDLDREFLANKLGHLLQIQNEINDGDEPSHLFQLICDSVRKVVEGFTCHLRVYDLKRGDFCLAAFSGEREAKLIFEVPKKKGAPFSGLVANTKKRVVYNRLQADENFIEFKRETLSMEGLSPASVNYLQTVRSAVVIPIFTRIFDDEVDAILSVSSKFENYFTDGRCALIGEFVNQATIALTKYWLKNRRDEVHDDFDKIIKMMGDISERLSMGDSVLEVTALATERISEILHAETASIFIYNDRNGLLESIAEFRGATGVPKPSEVFEPGESLTGSVFKKGETIQLPAPSRQILTKPTEDRRYNSPRREAYIKQIPSQRLDHYLGVPIKVGERVTGVLRAVNKKSSEYQNAGDARNRACLLDRGFTEDCRSASEIAASHLAIAIRNAELIEKLNRKFLQLESVNEVGRAISSEMNVDDLLELVTDKTAEVMKAEICLLFLKNESEDSVELKQISGMDMIPGASYDLGEGVTGSVAESGRPVFQPETESNNGKYDAAILEFLQRKHNDRRKTIESVLVAPVAAKGKILGVIKVINKVEDHFQYDAEDLALFEAFCGFVGVAIENARIYDLTNRKLAEAEKSAALSQLVRALIHEVNNTLGLIPVNAEAIRRTLPENAVRARKNLDIIDGSARELGEFANELNGFSDAQMGHREPVEINEAVTLALEEIMPKVRSDPGFADINVTTAFSNDRIVCTIYKNLFVQIVRNIALNAYQAMKGKKRGTLDITSRISESGDVAIVEFEDSGAGIKSEDLEKIFNPGFSTKGKGNFGLGLWLVKNHMERIGGLVEVKSAAGQGTTFTLTIPMAVTVPDVE
jgi:signal transduction histidine kinase/ActR/RegA family two-component response regulator